ncbi:MAG: DUF2252 domain-containing protein [Planctomycetaceae bacterium]|nr:DUF2252 domain-containing protein [Planctomycetaceae bacterium]
MDRGDDPFAVFAARVAAGELLVPPHHLTPHDRRRHARRTLMFDHRMRLKNRPEAVQAKFEAMAASVVRFFRGTALLYYRDLAGTDADMPIVLCLGDVHPENFGVMPGVDGTPVFGPNDFDEAHFAPFTYDVKRGAVGFELAMKEAGLKKNHRLRVIEAFARGYVDALKEFSIDDREADLSMRIDNSPPIVRELLERSMKERSAWLAKIVNIERGTFLPTDEIVPMSSRVEDFQKAIDLYRKQNELGAATRMTSFQVKDVALKKGSGTASLGLERYFVLIDGPTDSPTDDVILEMKQARPSAITGLAPGDTAAIKNEAKRVVDAHRVHVAGGDPYYGYAELDGRPYLVRERSPLKNSLDIEDLDLDGWCEYAEVCGRVLALAHARCDADAGIRSGDAERAILESIDETVFASDLAEFARAAGKRIRKDWKIFKEDFRRGAFACAVQ